MGVFGKDLRGSHKLSLGKWHKWAYNLQGCRQGCSISVAFGGCGNINVCVHVPADYGSQEN